ncbi:MAG TPA: peptidoglycan DD-metalloendopeptidase family protein, partial [Solirubrobacterales bacterium]|nr:peptidoglycan DD-metalloendopeptidase family protein [Solirubrobacterales bacterium]
MAKPALLALALLLTAAPSAAADAMVRSASVSPQRGFTDSVGGVRVSYRLSGSAPADVAIRISGSNGEVRAIDVPHAPPGKDLVERWDGLNNGGTPVADGTYRVIVAIVGGNRKEAGRVELHRHYFPVRGPHGTRGPVGDFGALRNGGRRHRGFDVVARCGTPLAAAATGTVVKRAYDARLDGNYVVIRGLGERRKYWYAHMVHPSTFRKGDLVHVGQIVGHVGRTGNARTVGCHLHFEIHVNGRPVNPEPYLRAWD